MKTDHPILFSTPMVRALLDRRKTQTRRIVKFGTKPNGDTNNYPPMNACPYGKIGDKLWVRETFNETAKTAHYKADFDDEAAKRLKWKPSIFMPRSASRLTLEIMGIRIQLLQDISEADAKSEGCITGKVSGHAFENIAALRLGGPEWPNAKDWYADLWESINGIDSWWQNPLVWALTFTVHMRNIDA